jgi:excisionase family DNA binding protein
MYIDNRASTEATQVLSRDSFTDFLSPADLAHELRLSERSIYSMLRRGTLPGIKLGGSWRVRRAVLYRMFEEAS